MNYDEFKKATGDSKQISDCDHLFAPLGFQIVDTNDENIEAIAAIHCTKCGLFRTKILNFIRELKNEAKA